ncbi:MAG: methyltransferase domain-containing protein [Syntrophorhabdales bacterium]|jgi:trans-aconitate methyltransferase
MYRWNPEDYSQHSSGQEKWARELISKLELKGDERILDIGCGDGKVTAEIASSLTGGSVLGVDSSLEMVEHAKKTFMGRYDNLGFLYLDVREMDFEPEFDIVFSNAALHWVHDHLLLLKRIRRALRPSGKVLLQMAGEGNAAVMMDLVNKMMQRVPWRSFFHDFSFPYAFYGAEEYRRLVKTAGLVPKRIDLIPKTMLHEGKEGLAAWIRTTWLPYTQRVPEDMREGFIEEIISAYETEHGIDAKGFFAVGMVRLEVEAVKREEMGE